MVCTVFDVMAIFLPMIALSNVDLPAFGLPTFNVTKPDLKCSGISRLRSFQPICIFARR